MLLVILAVGAALAGVVALLGAIGIINFDTSKITKSFEAIKSGIDPEIVANARRQTESASNNQQGGTTVVNQTNNIETTGDAEELALTVGDATSDAIHQNVYVSR